MRALIISLFIVFMFTHGITQIDLRKDEVFFKNQLTEFHEWLRSTNLNGIVKIDSLQVSPDLVKLYMKSEVKTDDSLKVIWRELQTQFDEIHNGRVGEKMFETLSFLFDLGLDSLQILILTPESNVPKIKLSYSNYFREDENFPNTLGQVIINPDIFNPLEKVAIPITEKSYKTRGKRAEVPEVRRAISHFLHDYYKNKGTAFYSAVIDTSRSAGIYNKVIYRMTCLNNEIVQNGFFEFIQFKVEVMEENNAVLIKYDIQGKYASGILCPNLREDFYKNIDPKQVEEYAEMMQDKIKYYLKSKSITLRK
jgi:hypothetical protein